MSSLFYLKYPKISELATFGTFAPEVEIETGNFLKQLNHFYRIPSDIQKNLTSISNYIKYGFELYQRGLKTKMHPPQDILAEMY